MTILITGGTVVSSTGAADRTSSSTARRSRRCSRPVPPCSARTWRPPSTRVHRRDRQVRHPRRHRRPHPHGDAVRRHLRLRHVRDRHPRGGLGRHHDDRRLRRADARPAGAGPGCRLAREGRRQLRDRLRLPPDHRRRQRRVAQGDGRADRRGHHQLQAVHGLSGRLPVQRRADRAGHADRGRQRRPDHDARRERFGHRRARPAGARARRDRAVLPRRDPAVADRAGGDPPGDHAGRPDRRAALRRARVGQAGAGPHRRGPRRRSERVRRDLPAVPVPVARGEPRCARIRRGEVGLLDAAALPGRGPSGRAVAVHPHRRRHAASRPTTARSA